MSKIILKVAVLFFISTQAFGRGQEYDPSLFFSLPFILFAAVFAVVMTIAWIIVPFAIIGIKPLLRELIVEMRIMNQTRAPIRHDWEPSL